MSRGGHDRGNAEIRTIPGSPVGVVNRTIHKVNECVRVEEIDALHRTYVRLLERLLA